MTDNEITKALECCSKANDCGKCEYEPTEHQIGTVGCSNELMKDALDLINRQKSQILKEQNKNSKLRNERNRLKAEIERLKTNLNIDLENFATEYDNKIKAEAVKEFAERLKERAEAHYFDNYCYAVSIEEIDNLVKEMVGEG